MTGKKSVEVVIMGKKFMVRADSDEGYVHEVARLVDNKITEIMGKIESVPSVNVVILAAMNLADELLRIRKSRTSIPPKQVEGLKKKIQGLIDLVDNQLK